MEHIVSFSKRPLGYGALKGSRMRYGTDAKCSCRELVGTYTNEAPPSRTKGWQRKVEQRHLAEQTPEGDLAILRRRVERAQVRLTEKMTEQYPSYIAIEMAGESVQKASQSLADEMRAQFDAAQVQA